MAQPNPNRRVDLCLGVQQGIAYYGCRFIESFTRFKEKIPNSVITSAMRFYHLATRDRALINDYRLNEVAAASLVVSYGNYLDRGRRASDMGNQRQLNNCREQIVREVVEMWKQIDRNVTSNQELLENLSVIGDKIILLVDQKNRYINDSRDVVGFVMNSQLFSAPLPNGEQDMANLKSLARAYIKDWYYTPSCIAYDLFQTAICAIYTAKITLGIDTPMVKQLNYRLRSETYLNSWANALFQLYEVYPTIRQIRDNRKQKPGWISVERKKHGGQVEKEGMYVWDYQKFGEQDLDQSMFETQIG